jgi:hypothetical protein
MRAPDEIGLTYGDYQFWGNDLFWSADSSHRTVIKSKTGSGGVQTLIGHGQDETRGVDGFGTDGVDMVWTEASGRPDPRKKSYSRYETWTAKYSTNPAVVASSMRRVRSEPGAYYGYRPEVVGCGYSAHKMAVRPAPFATFGIRLVRLADGVSWELLPHSKDQSFAFDLENPLAISCDEIFVQVLTGSSDGLAAIRIDSLGPGIAPD